MYLHPAGMWLRLMRSSCRGAAVLLVLVMVMVVGSVEDLVSEDTAEILDEDSIISTELTEPSSSEVSRMSPFSSWLIFRRNSNKGNNRRSKTSKRTSKHGLPGPPGPPGPQGPPGPPALPLIDQLRDMAGGVCLRCDRPSRISTSFFSRLLHPVSIPRRSLQEVQTFSELSDSERNLQRGRSFNTSTGRYSATVSGFYQLTASLLIESGERVQIRLRDSVRAAICIESLCQNNLSVESVMGVAATGGTFTILLTGTLYLQAGEYVSVFVDNATGSAISVLQDSKFSGILLGI